MEEKKKDTAIILLSLLLIAMVTFNLFMAVHVRRNIDQCNNNCKAQMIEHNCITQAQANSFINYDLPDVYKDYNVDGEYEWK